MSELIKFEHLLNGFECLAESIGRKLEDYDTDEAIEACLCRLLSEASCVLSECGISFDSDIGEFVQKDTRPNDVDNWISVDELPEIEITLDETMAYGYGKFIPPLYKSKEMELCNMNASPPERWIGRVEWLKGRKPIRETHYRYLQPLPSSPQENKS